MGEKALKINFDMNSARMALDALHRATAAARTGEADRKTLEIERQRYGLSETNLRYMDKLEKINRTEKETVSSARKAFEIHSENIRESIAKAAFPSGENIKGEESKNDIWILERKYIKFPEELDEMRRKYLAPMNPTMLRVIERYAAESFPENADEFAFDTDVKRCLELQRALVKLAKEAFADPQSSAADVVENIIDPVTERSDVEMFIRWAESEKAAL